MNRRTLKELGVSIHEDEYALDLLYWEDERKRTLECIKGKPLSIQKQILKAYDERLMLFKDSH
jgi:hypothetical protein